MFISPPASCVTESDKIMLQIRFFRQQGKNDLNFTAKYDIIDLAFAITDYFYKGGYSTCFVFLSQRTISARENL